MKLRQSSCWVNGVNTSHLIHGAVLTFENTRVVILANEVGGSMDLLFQKVVDVCCMKDGIQKINMTDRSQLSSTHMPRVHTNASVFAAEHPVGNTRASNVLALVVGQRLVKLDIC